MSRIYFVIPWYGKDISGGAEILTCSYAEQLAKQGYDVEVLTTCCRDLTYNWNKNFYRPGLYHINGVRVRRFPVTPGNHKKLNDLNARLLRNLKLSSIEETEFIKNSINSEPLLAFLDGINGAPLIFIPYLYGITYWGVKRRATQSFLIPCLHDEGYAYMNIFKEMFNSVRGIIFNSAEEQSLARNLYGLDNVKTCVLGMGLEAPQRPPQPQNFINNHNINGHYLIYLGRKDATKNVPLLIELFARYLRDEKRQLKLVLIGPGNIEVAADIKAHVLQLGYVEEQEKYDALAGAGLLCQPSVNESFSIVLMESWLCHTPVLVNANCPVTRAMCQRSQGGLFFSSYLEFREAVNLLLDNRQLANKMAQVAREFVRHNYVWDSIINKLLQFVCE